MSFFKDKSYAHRLHVPLKLFSGDCWDDAVNEDNLDVCLVWCEIKSNYDGNPAIEQQCTKWSDLNVEKLNQE